MAGEARRRGERGAAVQPESGVDWDALWLDEFGGHGGKEDAGYWDARSADFEVSPVRSAYAEGFVARSGLRPGDTVIDMGCGSGALALPLAAEGHRVVACDISEGMLSRLRDGARACGGGALGNLDLRRVSWLGDWEGLPQADLFFASRSLYSDDLRQTLLKMEAHARRRVCVTVATHDSPRHDTAMLRAIGRAPRRHCEHVYLVNLLMQMGRMPELSYLASTRPPNAASLAEVRQGYEREDGPFSAEESERLDAFIAARYAVRAGEDGRPRVSRDYERVVRWAFVAWEPPA